MGSVGQSAAKSCKFARNVTPQFTEFREKRLPAAGPRIVTPNEICDPYKLKGKSCEHKLGWFLEHGDTIELDVEKIGVLKNKVERQDA